MAMFRMWKDSCYGNDKISSKRLIMYFFTGVAGLMILTEAVFTFIVIWKWANGTIDDCEFDTVFSLGLYGYVFGIIGGLAGINGFTGKKEKEKKKPEPSEEEEEITEIPEGEIP